MSKEKKFAQKWENCVEDENGARISVAIENDW